MKQTNSLDVRHLFSISLDTGTPIDMQGGPQGRRMIVGVTGGTFEGERLRGSVLQPSGDWITVRPNGSMKLDVRIVLSTDDGASIYMSYFGLVTPTKDGTRARSAPLFETGDERYAWINDVQAVGIGAMEGTTVKYQVYELL